MVQRNPRQTNQVNDIFYEGEALPDQTSAGAALLFTFSEPVQLVWVLVGGEVNGRVDPFGGVPSANSGIPSLGGSPTPITMSIEQLQVWAPSGAVVSVWGFRY